MYRSKSWWIDRDGHKHCSPDWADTCHRAYFRASDLHDDDMARASVAVNSIIKVLATDHPGLRLWAVPDGLVLVDEVSAVKSFAREEAAVTAHNSPDKIERALKLKPESSTTDGSANTERNIELTLE